MGLFATYAVQHVIESKKYLDCGEDSSYKRYSKILGQEKDYNNLSYQTLEQCVPISEHTAKLYLL